MSRDKNTDTINRMLERPDSGVEEVPNTDGGILARIYRRFLLCGNMTRLKWSRCMEAYVKSVESGRVGLRPDMVSVKGNMTKMLASDEFTWQNFIRSMRFLQTAKLRIIIERTDTTGKVYVVEEVVHLNTVSGAETTDDEHEERKHDETAEK